MSPNWKPDVTRYTVQLASGEQVCGAIHGTGGLVGGGFHNLDRVRMMVINADRGWPLGVFEPKVGHVRMYPNATTADAGAWVDVDLRGAKVLTGSRAA